MLGRTFVRALVCCVLVVLAATAVQAAVKLPAVIGDNMVLQRGQPVPIWGWADKGEKVRVTIGIKLGDMIADKSKDTYFRSLHEVVMPKQILTAVADDKGRWKVTFDRLDVGKPLMMGKQLTMIVEGSSGNAIALKNIVVGEVWVCSGQSNMAIGVAACKDAKEEVAAASHPQIRLFLVAATQAAQPAADVKGDWKPCTPESIAISKPNCGGFSAVAYYFGRQLHKELKVPIGLIDTSVGGTPAEFWTSRKALEANAALKPLAQGESSCLYNGMIAPLIPYAIRGAIWYQGEANIGAAYRYRTLFPAMIANWRADWKQGDFPFGFVQIAPYNYHRDWKTDPACCPELWEAQLLTLKSSPNTGMAVTTDITDLNDIHPKNKQEVGRRLALWAFANVYGQKRVYSGPIYKSMTVEGNKIRLQFRHRGGGLTTCDKKPLTEFTIAGEDQKFVPAVATIDGDSIVVHSDKVAKPVAVRFAWSDVATPNFANKAGLPASPFRTDQWKGVTEGK
jgi:sialate O-acetylesterase